MDSVGPFFFETITQRQKSILHRLCNFYSEENIAQILLPMVSQNSCISLRSLDWLVTNYAKKHNIVCYAKNGSLFNIYHSYKISLTHFRRRNFDPFRRRQRIYVRCSTLEENIQTTVGQVNFLHWAYNNGVLDYAKQNAKDIEQDMNHAASQQKTEKRKQLMSGIPKRRKELSKAPHTKCSVYQINTHMTFHVTSDFENNVQK